MTRESAISRATRHFDEGAFIADLARRVAYRTESQVPESRPQLAAYLVEELGPAFERMGFTAVARLRQVGVAASVPSEIRDALTMPLL